MTGAAVLEWMLVVPDVALWLAVIVCIWQIVWMPLRSHSDTWSSLGKMAIYVIQLVLSVVALITLNLTN